MASEEKSATFLTDIQFTLPERGSDSGKFSTVTRIPGIGSVIWELFSRIRSEIQSLPQNVHSVIREHARELALAHDAHVSQANSNLLALQMRAKEEDERAASDPRVKDLEHKLQSYKEETVRLDEECKRHKEDISEYMSEANSWEDDKQLLEARIVGIKKQIAVMRSVLADAADPGRFQEIALKVDAAPHQTQPQEEWMIRIDSVKRAILLKNKQIREIRSRSNLLERIQLRNLLIKVMSVSIDPDRIFPIYSKLF